MTHAKGELIAFLDADDLWPPCKLETMSALFALSAAADAAFGRTLTFADDPAEARAPLRARAKGAVPLDAEAVLTDNPVGAMSNITVRREVFRRTGGFDVRLQRGEDVEWLIRLIASGAVVREVEQVLVLRRAPGATTTLDIAARRRGWRRGH